jgi:hypothetical protein
MDTQATSDFKAKRPLAGVQFAHDDLVEITSGEHAGNVGTLIAIAALGEDPVYLVEIDSGFEVEVPQSGLSRAE